MNRSLATILVVTLVVFCALAAAGQDNWGPFDRLTITQRFLDAVYPDLEHYEGLLILRAVEFHAATGQGNVVDLVPCHPGSGYVTYPNLGPGQEPPTHCGDGRLLTKSPDFLSMNVTFGAKYPVSVFGAGGSFIHAKSEPVEKQIAAHPEWNDHQRLEALRLANPRFGPENKVEFLRAVPTDAILKFTGCRLQFDNAEFFATRQELGDRDHSARGEVAWRISGNRQFERTSGMDSCVASFEPFDGKLTYVGRF